MVLQLIMLALIIGHIQEEEMAIKEEDMVAEADDDQAQSLKFNH